MNIIKKILKGIFPLLFLKRAFLVFNFFKQNTFDRLFFKTQSISQDQVLDSQEKNPFLELGIDTTVFPKSVKEKLAIWERVNWKQDQYLVWFNSPGFIEPNTGWGLSDSNRLIYPSLGFSSAPHVRKPSFFETLFKKEVEHLGKIISLRDTGEENYFHFFNDVLPKLLYAHDNGIILKDYTIVVSDKLFQKPYFQFFYRHEILSSLNWHIQKSEWIKFEEAIFCKPFTHTKKYLDSAIDMAKVENAIGEKRLFLNRSESSLRFISNLEEIKPILSEFGFEIVDSAGLTMDQQIALFSQCRYLTAIHGAGITNILFRRNKRLSMLEIIHPSPYIPFHYIMLARLFGFSYRVLLGFKGNKSGRGGFRVDPQELRALLFEMINES